jgi:hypothetical protein
VELYLHEKTVADSCGANHPGNSFVCKLVVELDWKAYYINKLVPPLPWNKLTSNNVHFLTS